MSPVLSYTALIGGVIYTLSGILGLMATFEILASIEVAVATQDENDEEARAAIGRIRTQMILGSSIGIVLGLSSVIIGVGLFAQRIWAVYGWLALVSLVAVWTAFDFFFGTSGWLGTTIIVLVAIWSWVEYRTAGVPEASEFTVEGAIQAGLGTMAGTALAFAAACIAGLVFGAILGLMGERTGVLLLSFLSGTGAGFLVPLVLAVWLWITLLVDNERIRLGLLGGAFVAVSLVVYAWGT